MKGKTITTFLIGGNPQGVKQISLANKVCTLWVIPRSDLNIINIRDELKMPSFYILLGESEEEEPKAYLGETENFADRIKQHDSKKDFWQKALVFISKTGLNKAEVQYLEHLAVSLAQQAQRYDTGENKQIPKAPNLREQDKSSTEEFFEDVKLLISFVGCDIFEEGKSKKINKRDNKNNDESNGEPSSEEAQNIGNRKLFYTTLRSSDARGYLDKEDWSFTVLKGSVLSPEPIQSLSKTHALALKNFTKKQGGKWVLHMDITFAGPQDASVFCCGSNSDGWKTWKDGEGKTLDTYIDYLIDNDDTDD